MTPRLALIIARQYKHLAYSLSAVGIPQSCEATWALELRCLQMYGIHPYFLFTASRANGYI